MLRFPAGWPKKSRHWLGLKKRARPRPLPYVGHWWPARQHKIRRKRHLTLLFSAAAFAPCIIPFPVAKTKAHLSLSLPCSSKRAQFRSALLCLKLCMVQGVHEKLCFFLKILWFFWTLPVLLQRWCSTCLVSVHTLTPRENRERPESRIFWNLWKKTQYLMNTL